MEKEEKYGMKSSPIKIERLHLYFKPHFLTYNLMIRVTVLWIISYTINYNINFLLSPYF